MQEEHWIWSGLTAHMADPYRAQKKSLRGADLRLRWVRYNADQGLYQAGDALCIHNAATGTQMTMPRG
jgi:hypothetical protein